jgi:hypothetical protein
MEHFQCDVCSDRGHFGSSVHLIKLCLNFVEKGHVLEIVRLSMFHKIRHSKHTGRTFFIKSLVTSDGVNEPINSLSLALIVKRKETH